MYYQDQNNLNNPAYSNDQLGLYQQYPPMQPGLNVGSLPFMNFGGFQMAGGFNGTYLYTGNSIQFQTRMQELGDAEAQQLRDANINLQGTQVTEGSICCMVCTIIWGSILIFPICFMCCDWWKRIVNPAFNVPLQSYSALGYLLRFPNIQHLTLVVHDNYFDAPKAQALFSVLKNSSLKSLTFINIAMNMDIKNHEYSDFRRNTAPIKQLSLVSEIRWGSTLA